MPKPQQQKPKFCPLGFFSFYVNKDAAQTGGCHQCLGSDCMWYQELEDDYGQITGGQCAILGTAEALQQIAENTSGIDSVYIGEQIATVRDMLEQTTQIQQQFKSRTQASSPSPKPTVAPNMQLPKNGGTFSQIVVEKPENVIIPDEQEEEIDDTNCSLNDIFAQMRAKAKTSNSLPPPPPTASAMPSPTPSAPISSAPIPSAPTTLAPELPNNLST